VLNFDIENVEDIQTVHFLYHTSWGESYLKEYHSEEDLINILFTVLKDGYRLRRNFEDYCALNTPDPYKKPYKRIISLFKEAYSVIVENEKASSARFVSVIQNKFIMITREGKKIEHEVYPNFFNLLTAITLKPKKQIAYGFFSGDPAFASLSALNSIAEKNSIAVAYEEKGNLIIAYIMNETGNFFSFIKPVSMKEEFLIYLYDFCQNLFKRIGKAFDQKNGKKNEIKINKIKTDKFGELTVADETANIKGKLILVSENKRGLSAAIEKRGDETFYNIVYQDKTSSGSISFKDLGKISVKLLQDRKKGIPVTSIVRDLVFSSSKDQSVPGSTVYFLEKYKIESMIEKGMKKV
jgi:hypothetical protein